MKYQPKKTPLEAIKLRKDNLLEVYNFRFDGLVKPDDQEAIREFDWYKERCISRGSLIVSQTKDCSNDLEIEFGEYIVKGQNGDFYVFDVDTFEEFFEPTS